MSDGVTTADGSAPFRTPPPPTNPDCEPDSYAYLTGSAPDFVVYRNPADPAPTTEPEPEATAEDNLSDPGQSGGTDGDVGDGEIDEAEPEPTSPEPTPQETPDSTPLPPIVPQPDEDIDNPTIKFAVHLAGYQGWKATVTVYSMSENANMVGEPVASYVASNKTEVHWSDLFPGSKPESGLYFYDVKVEGTDDGSGVAADEQTVGNSTDSDSKETQRLDASLQISELQWHLVEEDRFALPQPNSEAEWQTAEIKFKALKAGASLPDDTTPYVQTVDPTLTKDETLSLFSRDGDYFTYRWQLVDDEAKKLGEHSVVIGLKHKVRRSAGAYCPVDRSAKVLQVAGQYYVTQGGNTVDDNRQPPYGSTAHFLALFRVQQYKKTVWYRSDPSNTSYGGELLGGVSFDGSAKKDQPIGSKKIQKSFSDSLGLNVKWLRFRDNVVQNNGGKRFYGLIPESDATKIGTGLTWSCPLLSGTSWWGFEAQCAGVGWSSYKGVKTPFVAAMPTNHKKHVYSLSDKNFNLSKIPGMTSPLKYYLPDPAEHGAWNGQISTEGQLNQTINFDRNDPFFNHGGTFNQTKYDLQTSTNENLLSEGERFLGVPYGWAGQTFGGKQSKNADRFTDSNKKARNPEVTVPGSSMSGINGYGIDCSGFITEVARRVAAHRLTEDVGTSDLHSNNTYSEIIAPQHVRPGDFIVWLKGSGGHIIYVKGDVSRTDLGDGVWHLDRVRSLEAFPDHDGVHGRVSYQTRVSNVKGSWEDSREHSFRRWLR